MSKIAELEDYISDDILDNIFTEREEDVHNTKIKVSELKKIKKDNTMTYEKLIGVIKNLPPHFKNCRESILNALEQYSERENLIQSFDNEKFYKVGFCDGVNMILDIFNKRNN